MVILHSYVSSLEGKLPFADPHLKNVWTSQLFSSPLSLAYPKSRTLPLEPPEKALVEEPRCCFHVKRMVDSLQIWIHFHRIHVWYIC